MNSISVRKIFSLTALTISVSLAAIAEETQPVNPSTPAPALDAKFSDSRSRSIGQLYLHFRRDKQSSVTDENLLLATSSTVTGGGAGFLAGTLGKGKKALAGYIAGFGAAFYGLRQTHINLQAKREHQADKFSTFRAMAPYTELASPSEVAKNLTEEMMGAAYAGMSIEEFVKTYIDLNDRWLMTEALKASTHTTLLQERVRDMGSNLRKAKLEDSGKNAEKESRNFQN